MKDRERLWSLEESRVQKPHKLVVSNRKTSMVTGVLDVLSFDLNEILFGDGTGDVDGERERFACKPPECGKGRG